VQNVVGKSKGMPEKNGERDEGLIKDSYELILKELQTVIAIFYLLLVGIGMLFTYKKYAVFGINIFEYADVFDFLIAPFQDIKIIYITLGMMIVPGIVIYLDRIWKLKRPEWYSRWNFGWDKKPWFNLFRFFSFGFLLLVFLFEGAKGYGQFKRNNLRLCPVLETVFADGSKIVGSEIGKTKEILFLMVDQGVRAVPINSTIKEIRLLKQRTMSDVMHLFDDAAEEYANKYWSVDDYKEQLDNWVGSLPKSAHVLDLGCGPGNYADYSLEKRPDLKWMGVDFSPAMIRIAKDSVPGGQFLVGDVTEKSLFKDRLQGVMISFVTPYLDDDATKKIFSRSYKALDAGGQLYLGTIVGEKDEFKAQPSSDPDGVSLITYYRKVDTYQRWLKKVGFEVLEVETKIMDYGNESTEEAIILARKKEDQ
jgi:cyclopropane fatty-acyl-phospholipid synthase-like methyltransferase